MSKKLLLASELRTLRSASSGILDEASGNALSRSCHSLRDDGYIEWNGAHWTVTALGRAAIAATNTNTEDAWLIDGGALVASCEKSATPARQSTESRVMGALAAECLV